MPDPPTSPTASAERRTAGARWTSADTASVVAAAVVLLVSTALAVQGTSSIEAEVFAALNGGPDWVFGPAWTVMQLGTVGAAAVVGLVTGYALRRPTLALVFAVTPIVAWFAARVVKDLVARGRPAAEGLVTTIRGTVDDGFGFPSGHSTVAFALATVVTPALPRRWRALPFVLATAVALARPYVGAHLPLDLVGGAALGVLVGLAGHGVTVLVSRRAGSPGA